MATSIENVGEDEVVEVEPDVKMGVWTETIEAHLICLIEEEVQNGNRPTTTLTKAAWNSVKQKLKEKTKRDYTHDQLKNKYNFLRQRWKAFKNLISETGIGYNSVTHTVTAKDDNAWKLYYQKHKYAKTFRKKGCKHYDKLCTIFGDTTATGVASHASTKSPSSSEDEGDQGEENANSDKEYEEGPIPKKSKPNVNPKKLRERVNAAMAEALVAMTENSKKKLELLERKMSAATSTTLIGDSGEVTGKNEKENHDKLMKCIDILSALEGIDGQSFANATKLIHDDPLWRDIFLRLPEDRRKDWVTNIKN